MTTPKPRKPGRSRIAPPERARIIPATSTRGARRATVHHQVRLGEGQREAIKAHAERLVMSGNAVMRAAVARLLSRDIPPPSSADQVPPALPSRGGEWSWIPAPDQIEQLGKLARQHLPILLPHGPSAPSPRGGRPGKPDTEARDALIRFALSRHLDTTEN